MSNQSQNPAEILAYKINIFLSPSEKLIYNISSFFAVYTGIKLFINITSDLSVLAYKRSNVIISNEDLDNALEYSKKQLKLIQTKIDAKKTQKPL